MPARNGSEPGSDGAGPAAPPPAPPAGRPPAPAGAPRGAPRGAGPGAAPPEEFALASDERLAVGADDAVLLRADRISYVVRPLADVLVPGVADRPVAALGDAAGRLRIGMETRHA